MKYIKIILLLFISVILLSACNLNHLDSMIDNKSDYNIYQGIADGYNDKIYVDVTIDNDYIKDVKITSNKETAGIGSELKNKDGKVITNGGMSPISLIPKLIVENQSINIDAVSGATVTSYGILHAVSDALIKANYRVDAVTAATEVVSNEYQKPNVFLKEEEKELLNKWLKKVNYETFHEDLNTDVVVIGAGGAGLAAALSAAENGSNVVVVEKNAEVGGNTLVCGAIYNAPDEELQQRINMAENQKNIIQKAINEKPINDSHKELIEIVKTQFDDYLESNRKDVFDSKEWFALQTYNGGDKKANFDLVKTLCYNSYDGLKWIKKIGVSFYDFISQGAGSLWERTHTNTMPMGTGFISNYLEQIDKNDKIKIITNTSAKEIILDEDGVHSILCEDKYGNKWTIKANKSVIIATGGFSANQSLLKEYNQEGISKWENIDISKLPTTNRTTVSTGDGIYLGNHNNADLVDMSEIQLLYLGNMKDGKLTKYPSRCVTSTDQILFINKKGERFVNEGSRRDEICKEILNQEDRMFYILESGDGDNYVDIYSDDFQSADGFSYDYLVDNNYIYVGDTLEELADKINIDVNVLKNTIDDFNECVDGKADRFGRTIYSTKIEKGPYIATPRQVSVHHTMGGLKINEKAQVLDKNGEVIKGLYACGEVTGGIHGSNRLGGNAVVDTVVFGRIAGSN